MAPEVPDESRPITVERLADDVREWLDALGCRACISSAIRPAAMSGQRLAIEDPQRIASLALFASTPG